MLVLLLVLLVPVAFGAGVLVGRNNKDKVEKLVTSALAEGGVLQADAVKYAALVKAKL